MKELISYDTNLTQQKKQIIRVGVHAIQDRAKFKDNNYSNDADVAVTEENYVSEPDCFNADGASIANDNRYDNESENPVIKGH